MMAYRRGRHTNGTRNAGYGSKGYNAKQKMMNIHFRYSETVTNYAERLLVCGGRRSLVMEDWSQAQLHHLDKIEFDALMARLSVTEQQALLAMPTVQLASVVSMASLTNDTGDTNSSNTGKSPLISPRPDPNPGPSGESEGASPGGFSVIPEEEGGATPSTTGGAHPGSRNKVGTEAGDQGGTSSSSLKSANGQIVSSGSLLPESRPRQQKRKNIKS